MKTWPKLQSSNPDFWIVRRFYRACMAHKTKPLWIVKYTATEQRATHFQVYQACENKRIKGQHPCEGGVNNKRIGSDKGFRALRDAIEACYMVEA